MLTRIARAARQQSFGLLALVIALSGTAYAASLPRKSVGPAQLRKNAVTGKKVKNRSLGKVDFKKGQLPAGATGEAGPMGEAGAPGTARAYATVDVTTCPANGNVCSITQDKNVTEVSRLSVGAYCVRVGGITPVDAPLLAAVTVIGTASPSTNAVAQWNSNSPLCGTDFMVLTKRMAEIGVRNADDTGSQTVLAPYEASSSANISFSVMVP